MLGLTSDGEEICLARVGDKIYAINNLCTHAFAWLDTGDLIAEELIVECPLHGGKFHLEDGSPAALPCVEPVKSYDVHVEGDRIFVTIED